MSAPDFNAEAAAALVDAWTVAESVLTAVTMKFRPTASYTAATGVTVNTWGATISDKKVFKWDAKVKKTDAGDRRTEGHSARVTTTKVLVRDVDITPEVPAADMLFEIAGQEWKVASVETPPTGTFYIVEIRK